MFGILNVYKPRGMTSHDVVSFLRRNLHMKQIGHAGTLDPDAEGVLPVLIGKATKLSDMIMANEKRYVARVRLGVVTDTDDLSGTILEEKCVHVKEEDVASAVESFIGITEQVPPMYSAIKVNGQKLYQLARKGIVTDRTARTIEIYSLNVSDFDGGSFLLEVHCSKGTYIRALCRDIGEKLGTGAAMETLIRTQSGMFDVDNSHTLQEIEQAAANNNAEHLLLSVESVLSELRTISVSAENAVKIKNGIRLRPEQLQIETFEENEMFRVYENDALMCVLQVIKGENTYVLAMHKSFF